MRQIERWMVLGFFGGAVAAGIGCADTGGDGGAEGDADATGTASLGSTTSPSGEGAGTTTAVDGTADGGTSADASDTRGAKFDVGAGSTTGVDCSCGSSLGFSYLWVANSNQSTVSKINTQTLTEEGRYLTRDDSLGDPSRTSVSLSGNKAAAANRNGGITAVWARPELCDPMKNGMAGLQTSQGSNDILPWGEDDCVDWYADFPYANQRAIAWAPGILDPMTCEYSDELLWTSGCTSGSDTYIQVDRLDGETGQVMDHVDVTGFPCESGRGGAAYGGAVDTDGNFWLASRETQWAARIDAVTLDAQVWSMPTAAYGMTVDTKGRLWIATGHGVGGDPNTTAYRFDPTTETWDVVDNVVATSRSGIQQDGQGRLWLNYLTYAGGTSRGLTWIDPETLQVGPPFDLPPALDTGYPRGVSIDLDGYVWSINFSNDTAARFDPDAMAWESVDGLAYPYTYSDMTGWNLQNNACNPEG